jgi:hypothetical protein
MGKEVIQNDRFANYIGIRLVEVGKGFAVTELTLNENHLNGLDRIQGGTTICTSKKLKPLKCQILSGFFIFQKSGSVGKASPAFPYAITQHHCIKYVKISTKINKIDFI